MCRPALIARDQTVINAKLFRVLAPSKSLTAWTVGPLACWLTDSKRRVPAQGGVFRGLPFLLRPQHLSLPLLSFLQTVVAGEFLDGCDSGDVNSFTLLNH